MRRGILQPGATAASEDGDVRIRAGTIADIEQCERLDGTFETEYVWQVDETVSMEAVGVVFRRVHIPRRMRVRYPHATDDLLRDWKRGECFLVAEELARVYGYLDMVVGRVPWQGWIQHLIVHPAYREREIAADLLQGAAGWARENGLRMIVACLQTKNDPMIAELISRKYAFHGFIDRYFANGDVAILFALDVRTA